MVSGESNVGGALEIFVYASNSIAKHTEIG